LSSKFALLTLLISGATVAGLVFDPEVRIDTFINATSGPTAVVCTDEGVFHVSWNAELIETPAGGRLWSLYSEDQGATWSMQVPVSDSNAIGPSEVRFTCDSNGVLYAVWADFRSPEGYAPYFSRSDDGGQTWLSPNVRISDAGSYGGAPSIACNGDGSVLVAAYTRLGGTPRSYTTHSTDGGLSWSNDIPAGDATGESQYSPVVAYTGYSRFAVLWKDLRDTESIIHGSVSEDGGGTWLNPDFAVPAGSYNLVSSSIDLHWDGEILQATWIEMNPALDRLVNDEVFYSRSDDGGYTWLEEPVRVDTGGGPSVSRMPGGIWALDSENIFITWRHIWNSSFPTWAVCSFSSDSGHTWSEPVRANPESGEAYYCDIYGDTATGNVLMT